MMSRSQASVLGGMAQNLNGEGGLGVAQAEKFTKIGGMSVIGKMAGDGREVAVNREAEGSADGGNTSDDVSTINSRGVPSVCGDMDSFNSDLCVTASLVGGDGDSLIKEPEKAFDGDRLVVVAEAGFAWEIKSRAHCSEMAFEWGSRVGSN